MNIYHEITDLQGCLEAQLVLVIRHLPFHPVVMKNIQSVYSPNTIYLFQCKDRKTHTHRYSLSLPLVLLALAHPLVLLDPLEQKMENKPK